MHSHDVLLWDASFSGSFPEPKDVYLADPEYPSAGCRFKIEPYLLSAGSATAHLDFPSGVPHSLHFHTLPLDLV